MKEAELVVTEIIRLLGLASVISGLILSYIAAIKGPISTKKFGEFLKLWFTGTILIVAGALTLVLV